MRLRSYANRGRNWEEWLELQHSQYAKAGTAFVIRTPPAMRILKRMDGGKFLAVFSGQGPPDYLAKCGEYSFIMEAKEYQSARWPFSMLPPHQAHQMSQWCQQHHNGHGLLLIRSGKHNATWVVLWRDLHERWSEWAKLKATKKRSAPGTASLTAEELDAIGTRVRGADWLPGALALIKK